MTQQLVRRKLKTRHGAFIERMFSNNVIALTKGELAGTSNVLCRVHSSCISGHAFGSIECRCLEEMELSQRLIEEKGAGIIIWLDQEGRGNGHLAVMKSQELKDSGLSQSEAYTELGYAVDARSFEPAAEVLQALGVRSIELLSGSSKKAAELAKWGVKVSGLRKIGAEPPVSQTDE